MSKSRASKTKTAGMMIGQMKEYKPYRMPNKPVGNIKHNRMLRRLAK